MATCAELQLSGQLGLARARALLRDAWPGADEASRVQQFHDTVRQAMPDLSLTQARQLHHRYRLAMQKSRSVQAYVQGLSEPALARHLQRHVQVEGQAVLDTVSRDQRPVVFVTPHYGHYALGCLKLIQLVGRQKVINAFYDPPERNRGNQRFEALFQRLGYGFNALFNDSGAVLRALRVLRRGEALTMMPDNFDLAGHVIYVPFFGRLVPAMGGTALFALKSQARVVIGYHCPGRGLDGTLKIGQPIDYVRSGRLDEDIAGLTRLIFSHIEAQIRSQPEHWEYLGRIDAFVGGQLPLGRADRADDWHSTLAGALPQVEALWPALAGVLREVAAQAPSAAPAGR